MSEIIYQGTWFFSRQGSSSDAKTSISENQFNEALLTLKQSKYKQIGEHPEIIDLGTLRPMSAILSGLSEVKSTTEYFLHQSTSTTIKSSRIEPAKVGQIEIYSTIEEKIHEVSEDLGLPKGTIIHS